MELKAAIVMGSDSDFPIMKPAIETLKNFGVEVEVAVASAHRTPDRVYKFVRQARSSGGGNGGASCGSDRRLDDRSGDRSSDQFRAVSRTRRASVDSANAAGHSGRNDVCQRRKERRTARDRNPRDKRFVNQTQIARLSRKNGGGGRRKRSAIAGNVINLLHCKKHSYTIST